MTPTEVTEKLQLNKLKDKIWYVVPSCATTGEGLFEGLVSTNIPVWKCEISSSTLINILIRAGYRITLRRLHSGLARLKRLPSTFRPILCTILILLGAIVFHLHLQSDLDWDGFILISLLQLLVPASVVAHIMYYYDHLYF